MPDSIKNSVANKIDEPASSKVHPLVSFMSPETHQFMWNTLNFTAVASLTSAAIVVVQSPVKTLILNVTKNGTFFPPYSGGLLNLARLLYTGTTASLSSSAARTVLVTGTAKSSKTTEGLIREEGMIKEDSVLREEGIIEAHSASKVGYIMTAALGDVIVTQPSSIADLRKIGLNFKWHTPHNMWRIATGMLGVKFISASCSYTSLFYIEEEYAKRLNFTDKKLTHFTAGALSGVTAAVATYPFSLFIDYSKIQATVSLDGKLKYKPSISLAKECLDTFIASPKSSAKSFVASAAKQLPLRTGLTATIFSLVAGVQETVGHEPLKTIVPERFQPTPSHSRNPHGLFNNSDTSPPANLDAKSASNKPS
jgi:hypothetical protein